MVLCEQCGRVFERIGQHWTRSSECKHPPLTERQYDICIGLLMGDGSVGAKKKKNQYIQTNMIVEDYLEYIDNVFGKLGTGVSLFKTSSDIAKNNIESGFDPDANDENYSDVYRWTTRSHPEITQLNSWYDSGDKIWPSDIDLTPTVLKHWYCSDGHYKHSSGNKYIRISLSNEIDNKDKISSYFKNVGLSKPNRWGTSERKNGSMRCVAVWNTRESEQLWEYMLQDGYGIPPSFGYKWPSEY